MSTFKITLISMMMAFVFFVPNIVKAENHHDKSPSFKSTQLTKNIFMLQGKGGNLGLIKGQQGLLLIDADYKAMSGALKAALNKHGGIEKVAYLINTH